MISDEQVVPAGRVLFREGDKADYLYIITDGEVDIQYTLGSGEQRTVDIAVAGELIMWSALVEPYRSTAVGTTRKDTKLVAIERRQAAPAVRAPSQPRLSHSAQPGEDARHAPGRGPRAAGHRRLAGAGPVRVVPETVVDRSCTRCPSFSR